MTTGPILHSNKSEELTESFTFTADNENLEEDSQIVNMHILSIGSVACVSLFFIIVASYVGYVYWRLQKSQRVRRRAPSRQLPAIPGVTGSSYEEPRSITEPSRRLPFIPPELEDSQVYLSVLPDENVSPEPRDAILENFDGMTDSTAYLIPRTFTSPPPSRSQISTLPSQRYTVKDYEDVEQSVLEGNGTYVPVSPFRNFDSWPDDTQPPIPTKPVRTLDSWPDDTPPPIPSKPVRTLDSWSDDTPPPIPSKVEVFV